MGDPSQRFPGAAVMACDANDARVIGVVELAADSYRGQYPASDSMIDRCHDLFEINTGLPTVDRQVGVRVIPPTEQRWANHDRSGHSP